MKKREKSFIEMIRTSDNTFMIVIPMLIGIFGGLGAIVLKWLIHFFQHLLWGNERYDASVLLTILIPAGAAFIVGMIIYYFSKEAKGHGVPEVMEAIALKKGIIRVRVVFSKAISSALTIASGGSVGREGPIIQIGSAIGSTLGQIFKYSETRMQTLVGCGAAAGIAAAFNAPIAGAIFAVEIILRDFTVRQFTPIVISSVAATAVSRAYYGDIVAFTVPKYQLVNSFELLPYAILGIVAGAVAILFVKVLYLFEDKFDAKKIPDFYKTAIGGVLIGLYGLTFPQVLGVGYGSIDLALLGKMSGWLLLILIFLKILITSITLGSGSSGGIFAPSLFMGAMTGGLFGTIVNKLFPALTAGSGAYALVAMSAVVGASTHAPITAIMIIFEMTNDYKIILPLMVATTISSLMATKLQKGSIYTLKLLNRGVNIHEGREINILKSMVVNDYYRKDIELINSDANIKEIIERFINSESSYLYLTDEKGNITGKISQNELSTVAPDYENLKDIIVAQDISTANSVVVYKNDHLDYVMKEFEKENVGEIPVVLKENPSIILGTIWRIDVIAAYNKEILKRDLAGEVSHLMTASASSEIVEVAEGLYLQEITTPEIFIGKKIKEVDVRNKYNVDIVLIKDKSKGRTKKQKITNLPDSDYVFKKDTALLILGERKRVEYLSRL